MRVPLRTPEDPKGTARTPISNPMLVCCGDEWQVCYKARGKVGDRKVTAWVYSRHSLFFCEVGKETHVFNLPQHDATPFFDDQFAWTVEEMNEDGTRHKRLGGANNIIAANSVYQIMKQNRAASKIQLRHGSRILRRSNED